MSQQSSKVLLNASYEHLLYETRVINCSRCDVISDFSLLPLLDEVTGVRIRAVHSGIEY